MRQINVLSISIILLQVLVVPLVASDPPSLVRNLIQSLTSIHGGGGRTAKISLEKAEDVGHAHYKVINNLRVLFEKELPRHHDDFLDILTTELEESICNEGDHECSSQVFKHTLRGRYIVEDFLQSNSDSEHINSILPDDFDPVVRRSIHKTFSHMDSRSLDDAIKAMESEMEFLQQSESINDDTHRDIGIAAISVGINSLIQWREVFNDPDHIFHSVQIYRPDRSKEEEIPKRRKLEDIIDDTAFNDDEDEEDSNNSNIIVTVGKCDVVGALAGGIERVIGARCSALGVFRGTTFSAISSSVIAALVAVGAGGGIGEFGGIGVGNEPDDDTTFDDD